METISKSFQTSSRPEDYHSKCVCQICTCHHHKCPESHAHIPMTQTTSYQHQYVKHPINRWAKLPTQKAKPYKPYDYINSSYRENYPGHKPQMREKIIPRVKNQDRNIPFQGVSEYKLNYPGKSVRKDIPRNKDKQFNPDKQPFFGYTTYRNDFIKKRPNTHAKPDKTSYQFPKGYKFDGSTTYGNSYQEKGFCSVPSFKPVERLPPKGSHDLTSMYQQQFGPKKISQICPIHILPKYPKQIQYPSQHVTYSKFSEKWEQK